MARMIEKRTNANYLVYGCTGSGFTCEWRSLADGQGWHHGQAFLDRFWEISAFLNHRTCDLEGIFWET